MTVEVEPEVAVVGQGGDERRRRGRPAGVEAIFMNRGAAIRVSAGPFRRTDSSGSRGHRDRNPADPCQACALFIAVLVAASIGCVNAKTGKGAHSEPGAASSESLLIPSADAGCEQALLMFRLRASQTAHCNRDEDCVCTSTPGISGGGLPAGRNWFRAHREPWQSVITRACGHKNVRQRTCCWARCRLGECVASVIELSADNLCTPGRGGCPADRSCWAPSERDGCNVMPEGVCLPVLDGESK